MNIVGPFIMVINAINMLISIGGVSICAIQIGKGDAQGAHAVSAPDSGDLFTGRLPTSMTDCIVVNIAENARWLSNRETEVERGNTIVADTLAERADKIGFGGETKANFLEAIEKYNSYVDAGVDADFQKNALNMKVVEAPFFAALRRITR